MKKVSVIIPNYNNEGYIKRCIDSVIHQDYPMKEVIVVDDGSNDGSVKIIQEYARNNKSVKLLASDHKGPNAARRMGLKKATGDYIMFVDSDDCLGIGAISRLVLVIEKYDVEVVQFGVSCSGGDESTIALTVDKKEKIIKHDRIVELLTTSCKMNALWTKIYRRELLDDANSFKLAIDFGEDLLTNVEVCGGLDKMLVINDKLYRYSANNSESLTNSVSRQRLIKNVKDRIFVSNQMIKFAADNICSDALKTKAFYMQLNYIWRTMKKMIGVGNYSKNELTADFFEDFSGMDLECIDIESLAKYVRSLSLAERIRDGGMVMAIARKDYDKIWSKFAQYRLIKKRLKGVK